MANKLRKQADAPRAVNAFVTGTEAAVAAVGPNLNHHNLGTLCITLVFGALGVRREIDKRDVDATVRAAGVGSTVIIVVAVNIRVGANVVSSTLIYRARIIIITANNHLHTARVCIRSSCNGGARAGHIKYMCPATALVLNARVHGSLRARVCSNTVGDVNTLALIHLRTYRARAPTT
jgi:hypothetical protein